MHQPLGNMVGNANEIEESLQVLQGKGPADVTELTLALGAEGLVSAGVETDLQSARSRLQTMLENGDAFRKFQEMVAAQGGDLSVERPLAEPHRIRARESGYVNRINSERLGHALVEMGGGRKVLGDRIDPSVGMQMQARIGDRIEEGQPLAVAFCPPDKLGVAEELIESSFGITPAGCEPITLIKERIKLD
jgi:thymidine phosphorylase